MVSKQRDRARRNRQRFEQLLNELEQQDREIAELYEGAGVEPEELDSGADLNAGSEPGPDTTSAPKSPKPPSHEALRGFVVRG